MEAGTAARVGRRRPTELRGPRIDARSRLVDAENANREDSGPSSRPWRRQHSSWIGDLGFREWARDPPSAATAAPRGSALDEVPARIAPRPGAGGLVITHRAGMGERGDPVLGRGAPWALFAAQGATMSFMPAGPQVLRVLASELPRYSLTLTAATW